jgi:hypothetical protein
MLQITSGKLFYLATERQNMLRGVLYSNLILAMHDEEIRTIAGALLSTGSVGTPSPIIYEMTEKLEGDEIASGVLISHTITPYIQDFGVVVSFCLNVICTPNAELADRLLSKTPSSARSQPASLIRRVFDAQVWCKPSDAETLKNFVESLIGLNRKSFLAAMKAMRTYVAAVHRVADDVELSYTLMIAAIESLAQNFDGHEATWPDLDEGKRLPIDKALEAANSDVASAVRAAVLESEHVALTRRFRNFAMSHLPEGYFRGEGDGRIGVAGKLDTEDALKQAYQLRSKYVHTLKNLPDLLTIDMRYSETLRTGHATMFTLQGLSTLARTVICEFVSRQEKTEKEPYNYSSERYGIMTAEMASEYWIGRPENISVLSGTRFLEGYLQQFTEFLMSRKPVTDMRSVMIRIEEILPSASEKQRRTLVALYLLFNKFVGEELRSPAFKETMETYGAILNTPSVETLMVALIFGIPASWGLEQHRTVFDKYFRRRNTPSGLRVVTTLEAGLCLMMVEAYRKAGQLDDAKRMIQFGADNFPTIALFRTIEMDEFLKSESDWGELLLPKHDPAPPPAATEPQP